MRPYSPGGQLHALASLLNGSIRPTTSIHRLRRGLTGYLIPVAPHAFVSECQVRASRLPTPSVFLLISTDFTPTLEIPATSLVLKLSSLGNGHAVEPHHFTTYLLCHLHNSLRPVIPDNAWIPRMTAAAGTELAGAYSRGTFINYSLAKGVYDPKAFILHAASLRQAFAHCAIFPAAASRRSSGRSQSRSGWSSSQTSYPS